MDRITRFEMNSLKNKETQDYDYVQNHILVRKFMDRFT